MAQQPRGRSSQDAGLIPASFCDRSERSKGPGAGTQTLGGVGPVGSAATHLHAPEVKAALEANRRSLLLMNATSATGLSAKLAAQPAPQTAVPAAKTQAVADKQQQQQAANSLHRNPVFGEVRFVFCSACG